METSSPSWLEPTEGSEAGVTPSCATEILQSATHQGLLEAQGHQLVPARGSSVRGGSCLRKHGPHFRFRAFPSTPGLPTYPDKKQSMNTYSMDYTGTQKAAVSVSGIKFNFE